jgi:hypothetical protein
VEQEMRQDCTKKFEEINDRLHDGDLHFNTLDINMKHLTTSLDGLSKAIWGACGTALILLTGFVFWYIQSK